jgi:hypothetical protein
MFRPKTKNSKTEDQRTKKSAGAIVAALTLAAVLTGCSGIYMDRRDSIVLGAGDAVAANQMAQMYDPWPPHSNNVNYAANGQRMQSAVERYRTNTVTQPVSPMGLQVATPTMSQTNTSQNSVPSNISTVTQTAGSSGAPTTNTTTISASGQ